MQILIFIAYLLFFTLVIERLPFIRKAGLPRYTIYILFIIKVSLGCLYGWIHTLRPDYLTTMDTWKFYSDGLKETAFLKKDPAAFFRELFYDPYNDGYGKILGTTNSYWNDLKHNLMIKLSGLFNLLSGGHYYTNVIFYNVLAFFGPVAIYRTGVEIFRRDGNLLMIGCFGIPSFLFWTSGFHKEGLLFSAVGLIIFYSNRFKRQRFSLKGILLVLTGFFILFMLRNNVLFALFPAWIFWLISEKFPRKTALIFISGSILFVLFFFISKYIIPRADLPLSISLRQKEFMALGGNTAVQTDTIQPDFKGITRHFPVAADMAFLRPHPGEGGKFYIPFTFEIVSILLLFILFLWKHRHTSEEKPFLYFCFCFSIILCLVIGFTITNTGATIRYRSIVLPFLFLALIIQIDWKE